MSDHDTHDPPQQDAKPDQNKPETGSLKGVKTKHRVRKAIVWGGLAGLLFWLSQILDNHKLLFFTLVCEVSGVCSSARFGWICFTKENGKHKAAYILSSTYVLIGWAVCGFLFWQGVRDRAAIALPWMEIKTEVGLSGPSAGNSITADIVNLLRERRLLIQNKNHVDLRNFASRIQLPEPVLIYTPPAIELVPKAPPGVHILWTPEGSGMHSFASGQGAGVTAGRIMAKSEWLLEIDTLPALSTIEVPFITVPERGDYHLGPSPDMGRLVPTFTDTNSELLVDYLSGHFQFSDSGQWKTQTILMAVLFDPTNRAIHTLPPEGSAMKWKNINERHTGGQ